MMSHLQIKARGMRSLIFARLFHCTLVLGLSVFATNLAQAAPQRSSIVMDGHSGTVLSRSHANEKRYPASLTKMMTIYLLLEQLEQGNMNLTTKMKVSKHASSRPRSKLWLKPGEKISVSLALSALVVRSANDVAVVVAEHISGSETAFAKLMTRRARELGMLDTTFKNASGLYDWGQITTARDMGRLAFALLNNFPRYKHIWSQTSMSYRGHTYRSHNNLLKKMPGAIGMKTGYIRASGYNVVGVSEQNGKRVITVVIGERSAKERDRIAMALTHRNMRRASSQSLASKQITPLPRPIFEAASPAPVHASATKLTRSTPASATSCQSVDARSQKGWAVQLGAFKALEEAHAVVLEVMTGNNFDKIVKRAEPSTSAIDCNGKRLYRARLAGLTQKSAQALCSSLKRNATDCFTISP